MEIIKELAKLLGLGEDATEEQIVEALKACVEDNKALKEAAEAAKEPPEGSKKAPGEEDAVVANKAVCELLGLKAGAATEDVTAKIMELKGGIVGGVNLALELKALKQREAERDADAAVELALKGGKITPAQREWAKEYALTAPNGFAAFMEKAPQVVPLDEIAGRELALKSGKPDEATMLVCKQLGIDAEDVKKYGSMKED